MVPRNPSQVNVVELAENASRDYIEASDRVVSLVDRLGDAHAKLTQLRRQRDEVLFSAVTCWHNLAAEDQTRLRVLLRIVRQEAAEKLLDSIAAQPGKPKTGKENFPREGNS